MERQTVHGHDQRQALYALFLSVRLDLRLTQKGAIDTGWICYSSEADDDEVHRKGRWVHPCKCNLFCHESCLLSWIAEYQSRDERRDFASTVSCPQCKTPYIIRQSPSRLLETLEGLKKGWEKLSTRAAVCGVGFGITSISYVYGMSACQAFLGPQAFDQLIRQPTGQIPLKHWAFMPWVAPGLVLSRTNLIDGLLPVVPLLLLNIPPHSFFTGDYSRMISGLTVPGPATTCLMLPFVRHAYRRVRAWVFSKAVKLATSRSRLGSSSWASQPAPRVATPAPNTPAVQFDQPPELPPRRAGAEEGAEHDVFPPQPEDEHPVAAPGAMLTLSIHRVARVVVEALLLPFVSAVAGEALLEASQFSRTLRTILGVEDSLMVKPYLGWVPGGFLGTLDPAWWRNFIGGSLCVVAKDVVDVG